ncbi:MAG: hypothetical protein ACI4FN_06880 [Acutalibacteraceae bacterium]
MLQNIKVDIVYYKTNTDFEMEFNLCGCCRMRLLTDKAADKKSLVHDLARAVSRSRVIIITGQLFGEEGIIDITARAIAKTLSEIDNGKYGINSDEKISVINGATPLVTPDGTFAGCIIESGPQSMILLSDNKTVRKTVMKTLIHPYIEELYTLDLKAKPATVSAAVPTEATAVAAVKAEDDSSAAPEEARNDEPSEQEEETAPESEEASSESDTGEEAAPQEDKDEPAKETDESGEQESEDGGEEGDSPSAQPLSSFTSKSNDVAVSGGMSFTEDGDSAVNEIPNVFIEPEKPRNIRREYYRQSYAPEDDDNFVFHYDEDYPKKNSFISSGNLPILILSIILLIVLAVLCYCIFYVPARDGVTATAYLQEIFSILFG